MALTPLIRQAHCQEIEKAVGHMGMTIRIVEAGFLSTCGKHISPEKQFRLLNVRSQSIVNNTEYFKPLLLKDDPQVAIITET